MHRNTQQRQTRDSLSSREESIPWNSETSEDHTDSDQDQTGYRTGGQWNEDFVSAEWEGAYGGGAYGGQQGIQGWMGGIKGGESILSPWDPEVFEQTDRANRLDQLTTLFKQLPPVKINRRSRKNRSHLSRSFGFPRLKGDLQDVRIIFENFASHGH